MKKIILCASLLLLLAGCATNYREDSFFNRLMIGPGGFREMNLGSDTFNIEFRGNEFTSRTTMQTYWLYRCAEVAIVNGYDGFDVQGIELVDRGRIESTEPANFFVDVMPAKYVYIPIYTPSGPSAPMSAIGGLVKMIRGEIPGEAPRFFNAKQLKADLDVVLKQPRCDKENICEHQKTYLSPLVTGKPKA